MSTSAPAPGIPLNAIVDLAKTRDGLLRWVRLRALWDTLHAENAQGAREAALVELASLLDAALPEAEAHAVRLAAFYDAHADAVDALLRDAPTYLEEGRMKDRLRAAGPGYAAEAAARARSFVERGSSERALIEARTTMAEGDSPRATLCAALGTMQEEADVACISTGDTLECAFANLVAELSDQYC